MSPESWMELVGWVDARWAGRTWSHDQAKAYYTDLKNMDAADVWDAMYHLYGEGREYPPTGSVLMSKTRDIYVTRARADAAQQLPPPAAPEGATDWDSWAHQLGYTGLALAEAVRVSHHRQFPKGCGRTNANRQPCDVCAPVEA